MSMKSFIIVVVVGGVSPHGHVKEGMFVLENRLIKVIKAQQD